jgi:hypothetical protein
MVDLNRSLPEGIIAKRVTRFPGNPPMTALRPRQVHHA